MQGIGARILRLTPVAAVFAYLCSGFYMINPSETGVVRRFGKVATTQIQGEASYRTYAPGLHYRLPWPVTRLDRMRPLETKTVAVGFERMDEILGRAGDPARAAFLAGDQNIMQLRMTVQYTLADPVAYLLNAEYAGRILEAEAEACLSAALADMDVDTLIGPGRAAVSARVREALDRDLQRHRLGLSVRTVNFQAPAPPKEVADAFNEVQTAKAEKRRMALEAETYRNELVTRAAGEADQVLREGEAYRTRRVAEAQGEAARFTKLYEEYRQAKYVTGLRLYIEAMEEILPKMKKVFVDESETGGPLDLGLIQGGP